MGGGVGGLWVVGGSLVVARAEATHAGHYTCLANNTAGHARLSVHLLVTLPLSVQVSAGKGLLGRDVGLSVHLVTLIPFVQVSYGERVKERGMVE